MIFYGKHSTNGSINALVDYLAEQTHTCWKYYGMSVELKCTNPLVRFSTIELSLIL